MKRYLLISDTHGSMPIDVTSFDVDGVFHAGDVGGHKIVNELLVYDERYIVEGNADMGWSHSLPFYLTGEIEGVRFFLVHNLTAPHRIIPENKRIMEKFEPRLVIFGHTHLPFVKEQSGVLFVNPGSLGKAGLTLKHSYGIVTVETGALKSVEIFEVGRKVPFLKWER